MSAVSPIEQSCRHCGLGRRVDGTIVAALPGIICPGHDFQTYQLQPSATGAGGSTGTHTDAIVKSMKVILCVDREESAVVRIPLDPSNSRVVDQVASYFTNNKTRYVSSRRAIDFSCYLLSGSNNERVDDIAVINSGEVYRFALPAQIIVESACYWTESKLQSLGITIKEENDINCLLSEFEIDWATIENECNPLSQSLNILGDEFVRTFVNNAMPEDTLISQEPLIKSVLVVKKYPDIESAVDLMVIFLLNHCGFYRNRLFAFPQFPFKILFGDKTAEAKPDFTIFDLLSYYRIAVVEDKSQFNPTAEVNVEAQLIAEAIAMAQANTAKCESHPAKRQKVAEQDVLGIRVRGTLVSFYVIPVTDSVLEALRTRTSVNGFSTEVKKTKNFDLIHCAERLEILKLLCSFRKIAEENYQ